MSDTTTATAEPQSEPAAPAVPDTGQQDVPPTPEPAAKPDTGDQLEPAQTDATDWKAEAEKFQALQRKWEERAKANADAKAELDKIRDSQKSEQQRLEESAAAAQRRADEAEQRALRLEVAAAKNLTPAQARRLVGTTKEELEGDADDLLASFAPPEPPSTPAPADPTPPSGDKPRRPTEQLKPGAAPDTEPEPDFDELATDIFRGPR